MTKHYQTHIAGIKFREGAAERLASLGDAPEFTLEPEPGNKYDPNAIKVLHEDMHVGYVPKDLAPEIGRLLGAGRVTRVVRKPESKSGTGLHIHFNEEGDDNG